MDTLRARLVAPLVISIATLCSSSLSAQQLITPAVSQPTTEMAVALSAQQWSPPPLAASNTTGLTRAVAALRTPAWTSTSQPGVPRAFLSRRSDIERPLIADVAKRIVLDPTTYAPAAIVYSSLHLDWKSSQPMFHAGYVEAHPGYTQSGFPNDVPVDYAEGRRRNLDIAFRMFGRSVANNAASAVFERLLIERAPQHRKLIRVLGWIERTAFASYFSYVLSEQHFAQWQRNEAMARQIGGK